MNNYKIAIGLEIHVQLKTKSKMFCGCANKSDDALPNSLICPICMGFPGVLPVANQQAILWTIKTALALNCEIAKITKFDRKHYFYPDLPKNYQISQYDMPIAKNGWLEINGKKIGIRRVHLEEDAAKLVHKDGYSLVDFNRSGTPLVEIVTAPDISMPSEAKQFLKELRTVLRYLEVSDADMEKGHLRCDANISLSADSGLGTPVEIKNMNSFKMVERALAYEINRQAELLKKGKKIIRETRGWIDKKGVTVSQRAKEEAPDYRYFPEPDLPPFKFDERTIAQIKKNLPELPNKKRKRFIKEYHLGEKEVNVLVGDWHLANYFEEVAKKASPKRVANWIIVELLARLSEEKKTITECLIKPSDFAIFINQIEEEKISGPLAKEVFNKMWQTGKNPIEIINQEGFKLLTDEAELVKIVNEVISENSKAVSDFQKGKTGALQFLVGQVMRRTKGQGDPGKINKLLIDKLKNETKKNPETD